MLELEELVYEVANEGRKKRILDRVSGVFQPGELVVITGRNGSGKSTLAQLIMGIKKPTSGRIVWNGQDITNLSITERARLGLALAFQQPVKLKGVTVYNLIDLALGGGADPRDIKKYLEMVGLMPAEYLDREIDNGLSGGELKRIEIASVLARQARVMVLDEPEAGIDLWSFDFKESTSGRPPENYSCDFAPRKDFELGGSSGLIKSWQDRKLFPKTGRGPL